MKSAHREFAEETESEMIDGNLDGIYYNANVGTLFLVYDANHPFMERTITTDDAIDHVKEYDINELPELSFPTDNAVIIDILNRKKTIEKTTIKHKKSEDTRIKKKSRYADNHDMVIYECGCYHQKYTFDAWGRPVMETTFLCDKHKTKPF